MIRKKTIQIPCPNCKGSGTIGIEIPTICNRCDGNKKVYVNEDSQEAMLFNNTNDNDTNTGGGIPP